MTDTDTRWGTPLTLLQTPMAIVRQELSEGKRYNRSPMEIAGRLLGAYIGITKRETGVEVSWLTKEREGTQMGIRLRQAPAGAAIEARGAGFEYRVPPHVELKPAFRAPDNDHATLAASMGTLFDIANDNAWRPTMLDEHDIGERVRLSDHARALRRALANWLSLNSDEAMVSAESREHALNDLQRRINIVRGRGRVQPAGAAHPQAAGVRRMNPEHRPDQSTLGEATADIINGLRYEFDHCGPAAAPPMQVISPPESDAVSIRSESAMKIDLKAWNTWVDREEARRRLEDNPPPNTGLLPAEELGDEYALDDERVERGRGPGSTAIRSLLAGACAGWKEPPDSTEFYEAMRAEEPSRRQKTIAAVLIAEGTANDVLLAYLQGAFTWRQLGRMMHRRGLYSGHLARYVNRHRVRR